MTSGFRKELRSAPCSVAWNVVEADHLIVRVGRGVGARHHASGRSSKQNGRSLPFSGVVLRRYHRRVRTANGAVVQIVSPTAKDEGGPTSSGQIKG